MYRVYRTIASSRSIQYGNHVALPCDPRHKNTMRLDIKTLISSPLNSTQKLQKIHWFILKDSGIDGMLASCLLFSSYVLMSKIFILWHALVHIYNIIIIFRIIFFFYLFGACILLKSISYEGLNLTTWQLWTYFVDYILI